MRWLLLLMTVSAYADCIPQTVYRTPNDYVVGAVIDDGGLYVELLLARNIQRVDLASGETSVVFVGTPGAWGVQHGYLATPVTIGRPADQVRSIEVRDGYVYWVESDGVLQRMLIGGGPVEALAALDIFSPRYRIFEDRVVFLNGGKLFWKPLAGGATVLVSVPSAELGEIGTVSRDSILVTAYSQPALYQVRAYVLRTSWDGASAETLYETTGYTYHDSLQVTAVAAGATTYIIAYQSGRVATSVIVLRDGIATTTYSIIGPIGVLAATEAGITVTEWGMGTGTHVVVQLCASLDRRRGVKH
jgi:hypothetical protein